MKRREAIRQQLEQAHCSQYTPAKDRYHLGPAGAIEDGRRLSASPQGEGAQGEPREEEEKLEAESCPFKPQLDRSQQLAEDWIALGVRPGVGRSLDRASGAGGQERQERLERQRREVEAEKLRDCTFHRRSRVPTRVPTRRPMRSRS